MEKKKIKALKRRLKHYEQGKDIELDLALREIEGEENYELFRLMYINGKNRWVIAMEKYCADTTVSRRARKVLEKLAQILYGDENEYTEQIVST